MAKLNNKFGVYMAHLENVIEDTSKKTDCATLQGKFNLLSEANVILKSVLLTDLLVPAKTLSYFTKSIHRCDNNCKRSSKYKKEIR